MKRSNITLIIVFAGIVAALCMLAKAFLPDLYKSLSTIVFMFAMLGIAALTAPNKKSDLKSFVSMLAVLLAVSLLAFGYEKLGLYPFIKIPVFATLAALGMILAKQNDYALCTAFFAGAAVTYGGADLIAMTHLSLAFAVTVAILSEHKFKCVFVKVAAVFLVCLALCAFK